MKCIILHWKWFSLRESENPVILVRIMWTGNKLFKWFGFSEPGTFAISRSRLVDRYSIAEVVLLRWTKKISNFVIRIGGSVINCSSGSVLVNQELLLFQGPDVVDQYSIAEVVLLSWVRRISNFVIQIGGSVINWFKWFGFSEPGISVILRDFVVQIRWTGNKSLKWFC